MQVDTCEGLAADHHYRSNAQSEGSAQSSRVRRVSREFCGLNTDLPCEPASSIFVRADSTKITLWKALIVGEHPQTPCCGTAAGCPCALRVLQLEATRSASSTS